ncbi:C40 family peptidase [Anaerosacchariphilus polymeriproducens]|uniref:Hydrolase Nlp/P60 n=1 Tax=Anaerosacchariphilus polymeriproducens TaxID=1812858 RepID=A0A371AVC7_9FIRM|nr:NlpC/P60 family protein [Anaerosacchariphilus polymeriproducens]RDU23430.1 hydrolase Nlp/P60 [Anaerosacchariphilus polymeriproducens]
MKKLAYVLLAGVLIVQPIMSVQATSLQKEKQQAQEKLDSAKNSIDALENSKEETKSAIKNLDSQLVDLLVEIDILKGELDSKQEELDLCRVDLKKAKATEKKQYEDMKKRIRFMYENGDTTLVSVLLDADSITDLLNKAEYVDKIYESDRKLLMQYQEAKTKVLNLEKQLENDKADLESMQSAKKEQENSLQALISEKKEQVADFDSQLEEAKEKAAAYQAEVEAKNAEIRAAEQREAQRRAANNPPSPSTPSSPNTPSSNNNPAPSVPVGSGQGSAVVQYALQFVGNPYVWGGTSLTNGADCSGFTQSVFANFGVGLPRTSGEQRGAGVEVSYADAQPGDLICYSGHVAIYMGNGQIVHAANSALGIVTGNATYRTILSVRRVI